MLCDGHGAMVRENRHLCHCAWWTSSVKGWTEPMNGWNSCRKPNKQNRSLAYAFCETIAPCYSLVCKVNHFENNLCDHTRRVAKKSNWFLVGMVGSMCMFIIWLPRWRCCAGFCQRAPKQIMNIQYRMQYTRLWLNLSDFRIPTEHFWSSIDVPQLSCRTEKNKQNSVQKTKLQPKTVAWWRFSGMVVEALVFRSLCESAFGPACVFFNCYVDPVRQ